MPLLNYLAHKRDCTAKQASRETAIASLPERYQSPLTHDDAAILRHPVAHIASEVRNGNLKPIDILTAYSKRAIWAHGRTNCLTEIIIPSAEKWLSEEGSIAINLQGPLAGVPVSLKDTVCIEGYDNCIGYSKYVNNPAQKDSALVRLLKNAGAVPFVKTNVPITLLSYESTNNVWGRTDNPHVKGYSPGGSTGGEGALLALGGSRIGVGTDVAGSVRIPAHYSGIYTVRCSFGRFPKSGNFTSMAGQEGIAAVYSPMAKTLGDLKFFLKAIVEMKPWEYDHSVHAIDWEEVEEELENRDGKIKWGVLRDDGVVPPTPACERALNTVVEALKAKGDEVIELSRFPSPFHALRVAAHLLNSDGGATFSSHFRSFFESNDAGMAQACFYWSLPRWVKAIHCFYIRHIRRDPMWADLLQNWGPKSTVEQWKLVAQREEIRAAWHEYWKEQELDYILSVPNALPAVPENGMKTAATACGYSFLFNLLDYSAGVLPVTKVDAKLDALPKNISLKEFNSIARGAWRHYDSVKMEGLPVGVQVVGKRLEEEKVLWGMERIENALGEKKYKGIEVEVD
ncbi:hypothetical protein RUND412_002196 [Rhizina undulata]